MAEKDDSNLPIPIVREFLNNQGKELDIRAQESKLREKELDNNHELALKSLDAQQKFYNRMPEERRKDWALIALFILVGILILIGFCIFLFEINQVELAKYLITALVSAFVSGGGAYGFGFHRGSQSKQNINSSVEDV